MNELIAYAINRKANKLMIICKFNYDALDGIEIVSLSQSK